jgi:thiamine-monophosphate kinase
MGEFELIRRFFAAAACARPSPAVALGIGDDCALLQLPVGEQLAISTDTLVAGVHFPEDCDPFRLGQRALAAAASDLAAMGAAPLAFTLALTLPQADPAWLQAFALGLDCMARDCQLVLAGGDTTRGPLTINISVLGSVPAAQALHRSGARAGDLLCVGGTLGDAAAALPLVLGQGAAVPAELAARLCERYWAPQPQLALGQALRGKASAALDISDGLLADCTHLATASGVALKIEAARLPLSPGVVDWLGAEQSLACALGGGDDYRLVFTLPPAALSALQASWPGVTVIGQVLCGAGVQVVDAAGQTITAPRAGYQHFGGSGD